MSCVDCHAHVFPRRFQAAAGARYRPGYAAPSLDWMALWPQAQVGRGVLVQPSFLGTDNSYLLEQLENHGDRMRGVVVIGPGIGKPELAAWNEIGVRGVRLNLIGGDDLGAYARPEWQALFGAMADLGWHLELQCEGERIPRLFAALGGAPPVLVFDHFGLPDQNAGGDCAGVSAILREAGKRAIYVKLSAPYRLRGADARFYAARYLSELGAGRLLWGSDWPWTRHEAGRSYRECCAWLESWIPSAGSRQVILREAPRALYDFSARETAP